MVAPFAPTRLKHVAMVRPIASEPVAIVATLSISLSSVTGLALACIEEARKKLTRELLLDYG